MESPPAKELILPSPASRGLCETCARYNWPYHLTRHVPGQRTNALFQYEETLVKQSTGSGETVHVETVYDIHDKNWYRISNAPYLGPYYANETGQNTMFSVGPLSIAISSSQCSFCNLLDRAARKAAIQLPPIVYVNCWFRDPRNDINQDPHVLVVELQYENWKQDYRNGLQFALLGEEETEEFTRPVADPYQIDLDVLKTWRDRCDTEHGGCCAQSLTSSSGPRCGPSDRSMTFRVIDVKTDRVVPAPTNCSYIALSYVWGGAVPYTLNKADMTFTSGDFPSLANSYAELHRHRLPRTIQDAIFVVETLGERYLWVDCLCIVQDDREDLQRNIHGMDRIFSAANLTIVAASGGDSNAGLPGLYPGTRQFLPIASSIEKIGVVEREPPLMLEETVWGSRAWTYQEFQFSSRMMIFTNQRVYFQCITGFWGEVRPNKLWMGPPKANLSKYMLVHSRPFGKYARHVTEYSCKSLTYESDVLHAFTAIMEDYAVKSNTKFCWGLPIHGFSLALMWVNGAYYDDRKVTALRQRRLHGNAHNIPSWSWAGWVGKVTFDLYESSISSASKINFAVAWPWDTAYALVNTSDPFETGLLAVRVVFAVIDLTNIAHTEDAKYCRFDDGRTTFGSVECFLLGIVNDGFYIRMMTHVFSPIPVEFHHLVVLMTVERHESGIYYRTGLIRVTKSVWNAAKSETRCIQLG